MSVFVVKKYFKDSSNLYEVGSVITDPTVLKELKTLKKERKIYEVNEDNLDRVAELIKIKAGVDPTDTLKKALVPTTPVTPMAPSKLVEHKPVAKPVAKPATVKISKA